MTAFDHPYRRGVETFAQRYADGESLHWDGGEILNQYRTVNAEAP